MKHTSECHILSLSTSSNPRSSAPTTSTSSTSILNSCLNEPFSLPLSLKLILKVQHKNIHMDCKVKYCLNSVWLIRKMCGKQKYSLSPYKNCQQENKTSPKDHEWESHRRPPLVASAIHFPAWQASNYKAQLKIKFNDI